MENNWELCSIMVAVEDMDKAVKHYESIGITGFSPERHYDRRTLYTDLKISDPKELTGTVKVRGTPMLGPIRFGLDQPVEGQPFQKDFLDRHGEGLIQIIFNVDDIETETAKLVEKGFPVLVSGKRDIGSIAIFDTWKIGGVYFEIMQRNEKRGAGTESKLENGWKLANLGIVVHDMEKAVKYYESMGLGPFDAEFLIDRATLYTELKATRPGDLTAKMRSRSTSLGLIKLELLQPIEGQSYHKETLDSRGEGVVQLAFRVDDIEAETAKMVEKGFRVIMSGIREPGRRGAGCKLAMFDLREIGGLCIELVELIK